MATEVGEAFSEVKEVPELLSTVADPNLEVFQVTTDLSAAGNVRSAAAMFTPDSRRFVFCRHRPVDEGAPGMSTARLEYTLCEIEDDFKLRVLTTEVGASGAVLTPDGRYLYYLVDHAGDDAPHFLLKRIGFDDFRSETLCRYDAPVPGIGRPPRGGLSKSASMRRDGKMICTGCNFVGGDGEPHFAPIFINTETLEIHGFEWEPYSWRVGGGYFPGDDPEHLGHLLMGRCNRSQKWDENGKYSEKWYSDVHRSSMQIVTEYGEIVATVPIGGEGEGVDHPSWRGGNYEVVTHSSDTITSPFWRGAVLCAKPVACAPEDQQRGYEIPGGRRWDLTRKIKRPDVCHNAWDPTGKYLIADTEGWHHRGSNRADGIAAYLWLGTVVEDGDDDPYLRSKYLLHPRSSWNSAFTENCPVMTPDTRVVFFNSDYLCNYGQPQVFAVRGHEFPS